MEVDQVFDLQYDSAWNDTNSEQRGKFTYRMRLALRPLYSKNANFLGININTVKPIAPPSNRKKRATE